MIEDDPGFVTPDELDEPELTSNQWPIRGSFARQRRTASMALEIHPLSVSQHPAEGAAEVRELADDAEDAEGAAATDDEAGAIVDAGTNDVPDTGVLIN